MGADLTRPAAAVPTTVLSDGIAFTGKRFVRTGATAPAFNYLREIRTKNEGLWP
jgi:hypothetical protein